MTLVRSGGFIIDQGVPKNQEFLLPLDMLYLYTPK